MVKKWIRSCPESPSQNLKHTSVDAPILTSGSFLRVVLRAGHLGAEGRARLQQVDKEPGSYWVWRGGQEREPQRELTRVEGREGV